jgi:hypothetical protein
MENYPKNLPRLPIFRNSVTCRSCNKSHLDKELGPDFDYCIPMLLPEYSYKLLTREQKQEYSNLLKNKNIECPLYGPREN